MSSMLALLCVGWFALAAAWSVQMPEPYDLEDAERYFEQFIVDFGRNYADEHEKQSRFQIFKQNLEKVNSLNEKSKHAVWGITQFSDLFHEELKSKFGFSAPKDVFESGCTYTSDEDIKYSDAPESWDWREHGVVTAVKNQLSCGSCYSFSTTGNIEGQYAIKHSELVELSEQQIVDCDKVDNGCNGGYMSVAMRSLIQQGGSMAEADYPYEGQVSQCRFDANKVKVQITDCHSYKLTSQEALKQLLYQNGPIAIAIAAEALGNYTGGIVDDEICQGEIDHAVLLVGYGSDNVAPYWIVKNSWASSWGENGYFRLHRGEQYHSCLMMNELMSSAVVA